MPLLSRPCREFFPSAGDTVPIRKRGGESTHGQQSDLTAISAGSELRSTRRAILRELLAATSLKWNYKGNRPEETELHNIVCLHLRRSPAII